jgi:Family of unknown function (DUF5988)
MSVTAPNAILCGGPAETLPTAERVRHIERLDETFKLPVGNRREHFLPSTHTQMYEDLELHVFNWAYRTFTAE